MNLKAINAVREIMICENETLASVIMDDFLNDRESEWLYVLVQKGGYRHDICGVFSREDVAASVAIERIEEEEDHYHNFEVLKYKLNKAVTDGVLTRTVKFNNEHNQITIS